MSNLEDFTMPVRGYVFWPVGTGDSTTIVIDEDRVMQVDIRQMESSTEEDDPHAPVVDVLVEHLPKKDGKPYLSTFVLTHPDKDHCQGFADLLDQVTIGEIWFAPRVLSEFDEDLCDDAQAFKEEAERRVANAKVQTPESGDRVRIIGYADVLEEEEYEGFPEEFLTIPGNEITEIDGEDVADLFRAFVHAPFKDDAEAERNDTSVGLQVTLKDEDAACRAMLLGDLSNPTVKRIFDISDGDDLKWNVLLAPHHCSKSVMYTTNDDGNEVLDSGLMSQIEGAGEDCRYIISSSAPVPSSNKSGDNPPHAIAKNRYCEIIEDGNFICTQEHPDEESPEPVIITVSDEGCELDSDNKSGSKNSMDVAVAVEAARGDRTPPDAPTTFGSV